MSEFYPIDPATAGARKTFLIHNARLVDRDLDANGAVLVRDGKIERVFAGHKPARTTVQVAGLPGENLRVEIDCIAVLPEKA